MRELLSTYGSRRDVEPMVGLAVRLRALGAEMPVCAPPDKGFAELLTRRAAELVAAQFDTVAAAAEGCDALVATGVMPAGLRL
jgi:vancomycin aglycone glucosyltransferase